MRTEFGTRIARSVLGALLAFVLATGATSPQAHAEEPAVRVVIVDPGPLAVGKPASVSVQVHLADPSPLPLMLTPRVEGSAVEVVRGRLLRSDARDPEAHPLELSVPIRVSAAGTSVLHVEVATYQCAARCQPILGSARHILQSGD